ncbi:hypothetical protein G5B38_01690 [Pseudohalocynthiibacter aestuariivivens]|nr:hypothetical protein G5B38_01690 [Pseudohalocynthiibacter aestuariivivens]
MALSKEFAVSDLQTAPLWGTVVLDLTHVRAGALAAMILADMGARVIKVERPGGGGDTRAFPARRSTCGWLDAMCPSAMTRQGQFLPVAGFLWDRNSLWSPQRPSHQMEMP